MGRRLCLVCDRRVTAPPPELTFIICSAGDAGALTMVGDVNLFLKGPRGDPEFEVEVEIMIAGAGQFDCNLSRGNADADGASAWA